MRRDRPESLTEIRQRLAPHLDKAATLKSESQQRPRPPVGVDAFNIAAWLDDEDAIVVAVPEAARGSREVQEVQEVKERPKEDAEGVGQDGLMRSAEERMNKESERGQQEEREENQPASWGTPVKRGTEPAMGSVSPISSWMFTASPIKATEQKEPPRPPRGLGAHRPKSTGMTPRFRADKEPVMVPKPKGSRPSAAAASSSGRR
jgi:hypothetical protein